MYILASFWTFVAWENARKHFRKREKRGKIASVKVQNEIRAVG